MSTLPIADIRRAGGMPSYGSSPIRRFRRTKADIWAIEDGLYKIVKRYQPMTVRNVFYRAVAAGLRVAVTEEQIKKWDLPRRPTKKTDSRAKGFDSDSVEVDAIEPDQLRQLVEDCITQCIDPVALERTKTIEAAERETLANMIQMEKAT
jgi:hypothetical protein